MSHEHLSGRLSALRLVSIVIAFSAPLAVVAGYLAVIIALGNGIGAPMTFAVVGLILLLFSSGYTEIARTLPATGGFYVYITAGLGRPVGLGGTLVALLSYFLLTAGTYALLGLTASRFVSEQLGGPVIAWWAYVAFAWALSTVLSYRELSASAKILGVSLLLELALVLTFDGAVVARNHPEGFSIQPFTLSAATSGASGLALLFAASMFLGFESTAVYREEARDPERTIPRATYIAVIFMTLFYGSATYLLIISLGTSHVVAVAAMDPAKTFPGAVTQVLGHAAAKASYLLLCMSLYGAVLSMHNVLSRYCFRLANSGLLWRPLGRAHPRFHSPHIAAIASSLVLVLFIAPFALAGAAPDLLYARVVGVGGFGLIMLLFLTSVAVPVYLVRSGSELSAIRKFALPTLAALGFLTILSLAHTNFVELTGTPRGAAYGILAAIYAVGLSGAAWALWLRRNRPELYKDIGQS